MTPAAIVLAVAVAAWGPVAPARDPAPPRGVEQGVPAAARPDPAPPAAAPPPRPAPIQPAIIAKAPVDVRARPALVAAPTGQLEPRPPLHKRWGFWAIAGGAFAASVMVTIAVTRPKPEPYTGNAPPYYIALP